MSHENSQNRKREYEVVNKFSNTILFISIWKFLEYK
jgi:hypothetical protein